MSTNEAPSVTSVTPINSISSSVFKNMYMIAEIIIFSITTFYFYRKINSLTYQLKEMDTKIQQLEKTIGEQKTFINDKMSEMSSIVTNMLRQPARPPVYQQPVYQPTVAQTYAQTPVQPYTPQTPAQPYTPQTQTSNVSPQTHTQQPVPYAQQPVQSYTQKPSTPQSNNTVSQTQPQSIDVTRQELTQSQPNEVSSQQNPVYTPTPKQQYSPVIIPFEVLVVENKTNTNTNAVNTKMTLEEDDDDDLDKELGQELSELNE